MIHVVVRHKVEDWDKWKKVFDEHQEFRHERGSKGATVFRNFHDPNEVVMMFEWDNEQKAHQFVDSENLKLNMKKAGVTDIPDIYYLNDAGELEA